MSGRPVVVGVTGSPGSVAVTRWAAREASVRHCGLRIVHAAAYETGDVPAWRRHARWVLTRAAGIARAAAPGVAVEAALVHESPVRALTGAAAEADLLVLGAIGHQRIGDGPADPALLTVLHTVGVPIAVVHADTADRSGPVVVGIERPESDTELLRVAHECARRRGSDLRIVHALRPASGTGGTAEEFDDLARRWSSDGTAVHADVVDDRVYPTLLRAASRAGLLVMGARFSERRPWLRSTVTELALGADCPVLLVPPAGQATAARRREPDRTAGQRG